MNDAGAGEPTASQPTGEAPLPIPALGVDIVRIGRVAGVLERFGGRFLGRVLTPAERAYVGHHPGRLAGRWAAKEAVSKVLGLGVRGIGWREIEIERLPTGQPAVRLSGRAAARAAQLGLGPIAVSISHEGDHAIAVAFAWRTTPGRFLFPPGLEEAIGERERVLAARLERLRRLAQAGASAGGEGPTDGSLKATRAKDGGPSGEGGGEGPREGPRGARLEERRDG
jgi:holo-[acyl-carrier protein] synthase